jgi:hypothetical protein
MKLISFLITVVAGCSAFTADFNFKFNIINVNYVSAADEQRVVEGIQFFTKIVKDNCNINIKASIEARGLSASSKVFQYEQSWTPLPIEKLGNYYFRYYQKSVFELTTQHKLTQAPNAVTLFVTDHLSGHCGFAFPDIQFTDNQSLLQNSNSLINNKVLPWVRNRVLLGSTSSNTLDCANSNRLVAHELAHIFVQDNPPHFCWDDDVKKNIPCEDNNILATQRRVYPHHNGGPKGFPQPPIDNLGPDEPIILPAIGTKITETQCKVILNTLEKNR